MDDPILTQDERNAINDGRWFASLSSSLRHDILRCTYVQRYKDGDLIAARGETPEKWMACAKGAVRIGTTSLSGKQVTLTYLEPGTWFGDIAILDGDNRPHDVHAHGDTTTVCVSRADFKSILGQHVELYEALLRLHARRIRQLFSLVEDLNTLPLRARLAKRLLQLLHNYGVPTGDDNTETRLTLKLAQDELAQLLGASRQRVNQELKAMEREDVIRVVTGGVIVRNRDVLVKISDDEHDKADDGKPA